MTKTVPIDPRITFAKSATVPAMPDTTLADVAQKHIAEKNWSGYLCLFSSQCRLRAFLSIQSRLRDHEYWSALGQIWTTEEWSMDSRLLWEWLFSSNRDPAGARAMMSDADQVLWESLPNRFTVYRGQRRRQDPPTMSWTLSRERAAYFATRYRPRFTPRWEPGDGVVLVGEVEKKHVLALLNGRQEMEVLVPLGRILLQPFDE